MRALARSVQAYYPAGQASLGHQARLNVLVLVDSKGRVNDCKVAQSYNDPAFNRAACENIRRATFKPALDANGAPVDSYWNTTISYSLLKATG
ncbi:MAG: energy transducer TonB [Novosphingobium sp.]